MIHRRNSIFSNHRVPKAAPTAGNLNCSGFQKNLACSKTQPQVYWKKELERVVQDTIFMPKFIHNGTNSRHFYLAACALALLASLAYLALCLLAWVDAWAMSISTALAVVPDALVSDPPLMPGVPVLPFNKKFRIPESHPQMGDRSDEYALLRQKVDRLLPFSPSRSLKAVHGIRNAHGTNYSTRAMAGEGELLLQETYDIYNCPDKPPLGYPFSWQLANVLTSWPPKDTSRVAERAIYQGVCVFQMPRDIAKAMVYRQQEVPFVMQGDPHIARTVERWNQPGYLSQLLKEKHSTEHSKNNHFLYRRPGSRPRADGTGTELEWMTYEEWLARANVTDDLSDPNKEHWYFRIISCGVRRSCDKAVEGSEYLYDELPFFQPTWQAKKSGVAQSTQLYMGDEGYQTRGIFCRFGMRGVIAENHYDSDRNVLVVLGGSRRYILAHPNQCRYMSLYKQDHPSARHSNFDWSTGDASLFPDTFVHRAKGSEVVLQSGDALYLPPRYFHFIVSLELNMQCNTRSGGGDFNLKWVEDC